MRRFGLVMLYTLLAACGSFASKPVYAPADEKNPLGHAVTEIGGNEYWVTFRADQQMDSREVEDYAFQRASELAVEKKKAGFDLVDQKCGEETLSWNVPEHRGNYIQAGDAYSGKPITETVIPSYTHEKDFLFCRLRIKLLDQL
ncbi:MAG: hypothetical protein IPM37_07215 [Hahellaceae bacterium]|nr:hypothetical protein [Hahellaceae bacterium]